MKPKVGETNFYEVVEFYNGTVVIDPNTIKWKLYQWKDLECGYANKKWSLS